MRFVQWKQSNSPGEAGVTVGTTPDGGAPAGTGVALVGGAAWAGVVRPGGTGGDDQASAQSPVRVGQVGQESNLRNRSPAGRDDIFAPGRRPLHRSFRDHALAVWLR
jgi:hypothetical protein